MKRFILIMGVCMLTGNAFAQSVAGITGKRDTTYNVNSEYQKLLKTYPAVKMIAAPTAGKVVEEKNITAIVLQISEGRASLLLILQGY